MRSPPKPYVYIFVEVGKRELLSRLILAQTAARAGFRVLIGEKNHLRNMLFLFRHPPGIIIDKCGQQANHFVVRQLKKRGFIYTILDEEGIFYDPPHRNPSSGIDFRFLNNWLEKKQATTVAAHEITGNVRLQPKTLLPYYESELSEIRRHGDFILVCSSFDPIYFTYSYLEEQALDARFREDFGYIIRELSKTHKIIYRPHPSDGNGFANEMSQYCTVERRFSVTPWIYHSSLLINAKCTTSIEAYLLDKPSVTLSYGLPLHRRVNAFSKRFFDRDDLIAYVRAGRYSIDRRRLVQRYAAMLAGPADPADNIVRVLRGLNAKPQRKPLFLSFHSTLTRLFNRFMYRPLAPYIAQKIAVDIDLAPFRGELEMAQDFLFVLDA